MPISNILDSTSYNALDNELQKGVSKFFKATSIHKAPWEVTNMREIFSRRKSLAVSLEFYGNLLDHTNPARFAYLTNQQRKILRHELKFAFYIFYAQYRLDLAEGRRQALEGRAEQLDKCAKFIDGLKNPTPKAKEEVQLEQAVAASQRAAAMMGLTIVAPLVTETMVDFVSSTDVKGAGKTVTVKDLMTRVNERRLYWVWGNSMLGSVFAMLPDTFARKPEAQKTVSTISPVTGYMSWLLYYARFGINLGLLLKHTIGGPWMSKEERQIPWLERFKTQWEQRKFSLLNDSIWGLANMACFFWLVGSGMLGYAGNVVTVGLLIMDVTLTALRFHEEATQHNADIQKYSEDIAKLGREISDRQAELVRLRVSKADEDEKLRMLWMQLDALEKAKKQCEFDWKYRKYGLINDLVYAISLMAAFAIMCTFLLPPATMAVATTLTLGLVGAALCFVLNTAYSAVSGALEISKSRAKGRAAREECADLLEKFKGLHTKVGNTEDENAKIVNMKKQLYLDIKQLMAESDYQDRLVHYQKLKLVRSVLIDAMIPPMVFVAFMFLPVGIGLAVLAAGLALAILANVLLKHFFEPQKEKLPDFDQKAFETFQEHPVIDNLKIDIEPGKKGHRMFDNPDQQPLLGPPTNDPSAAGTI